METVFQDYLVRLKQNKDRPLDATDDTPPLERISFREVDIKIIRHWQDLLQRKRSELVQFKDPEEFILLGIVDHSGRDAALIRHIHAELHKFSGQTSGVRTVCTTFQSLQRLIGEHSDNPLYFPPNVLHKINFMTGASNYDGEELQDSLKATSHTEGPNIMIVGAHIAHAGPEAVQYCPSVAAVVGSTSPNPTHYPGSSRLQPRLKKMVSAKSKEYVVNNAQIVHLEDMMEERFTAWHDITRVEQPQGPPAVVFYRDRLVYNSPTTQRGMSVQGNKTERLTSSRKR
jgi:hypothetical protein